MRIADNITFRLGKLQGRGSFRVRRRERHIKQSGQLVRRGTTSQAAAISEQCNNAGKQHVNPGRCVVKELKGKVEEEAAEAAASSLPATVSVFAVELDSSSRRGFRINVSMERSRSGLLVSVLEALEDLGLDVLDADVSCDDDTAFRLQALESGQGQRQQQQRGSVDEQMVQHAVLQAISRCMSDDDE